MLSGSGHVGALGDRRPGSGPEPAVPTPALLGLCPLGEVAWVAKEEWVSFVRFLSVVVAETRYQRPWRIGWDPGKGAGQEERVRFPLASGASEGRHPRGPCV